MQDPTEYVPSKVELVFSILERGVAGISEALHIPSYLAWGGIILVGFWAMFFVFLLAESIIRYVRYALIILSTMWAIGFMLAIQYYIGTS